MYTLESFYKKLNEEHLLGNEAVFNYLKNSSPQLRKVSKENFLDKKLKITNQKKIDLLNEAANKMVETIQDFKAFIKNIENIFEKYGYYCDFTTYEHRPLYDEDDFLFGFIFEFNEFIFRFNRDFTDFQFFLKNNVDWFEDDLYTFITGKDYNGYSDYQDNFQLIKRNLKLKLDFITKFKPEKILAEIKKLDTEPLFKMTKSYPLLLADATENVFTCY